MSHEGIAFDDWLDLFLDYAIGLAIAHRRDEAYQICQAAKDSTVFQSSEHEFAIYVAWSGKHTRPLSVNVLLTGGSMRHLHE